MNRRARAQRLVVVGLLLVAAVGAAVLYSKRAQPVVELYRTVQVTRRDVARVIEATGHLDARSRFEVPAPFAGRLTEVTVKQGDRVQRGQVLARLDDRAGVFAVRNASASKQAASWHMAEAKSSLEAAVEERGRVERLLGRGLASTQEVANAKSAEARANATLEAARAEQQVADGQLASAQFTHNQGEIVAPIDGVVLTAPDNLGSAVSPERALFVVAAPLELMRVDVDVNEADIGEVRVGQEAKFEVQAFPGQKWSARVDRLAVEPRREGGVVTYSVLLLADNREGKLLPGMTASVQLEVARVSHVLAVREAALRFLPPSEVSDALSRTRLFKRVAPGQLVSVPVRAGLSDGTFTQIEPTADQPLADGDEIAVGLLRADAVDRGQPGISLGGK